MYESRRPRRRAHEDDNDYRIVFKRLQINNSKANIDLQHCAAEVEFAAKQRGEQFNLSQFLCEMIRLGIASFVEKHPKAATLTMFEVAKKFNPDIKVPEVKDLRHVGDSLIPSIIDYHKKRMNGMKLRRAFYAGVISEDDLFHIWLSMSALQHEFLTHDDINHLASLGLRKHPELLNFDRD